MSPGAKVGLVIGGIVVVGGVLLLAASKEAHAAPAPPKPPALPPNANAPPDVVAPEPGQAPGSNLPSSVPATPPQQPPASSLPQLPTFPTFPTAPAQGPSAVPTPPGTTFSIPNPLGGVLGTVDPATGNVFGPNGTIIGTFNRATGIFTMAGTGQQIQIPGFGTLPQFPTLPVTPAPAPPAVVPPVAPAPPQPAPAPPAVTPTPPAAMAVPKDTASLAAKMLAAEAASGWNVKDPQVQAWQSTRPAAGVADGEFGVNSALAMANEIGTLPLIRFWPKGSTKSAALQNYRAALYQLASKASDPSYAAQLQASAAREDARAYSTKGALSAIPLSQQFISPQSEGAPMDPIAQINRLGWKWCSDGCGLGLGPGVVLTVVVNKQPLRAFVPLSHVWLAFDQELQAVGGVGSMWVGEPFSVGGLFSFVKKAVTSIGREAKSLVPKAIQRAATTVVNTAKTAASKAENFVSKIPVLGTVANATAALALLPVSATNALVHGKRIDQVALGSLKNALAQVKTLAPYVQTVLTMVPGVGTGISAGLGAALALAQGQSITDAMVAAAKSMLPGGPAAQAAFNVAHDVMQGKPITTVAIDAIPGVSPQAKTALMQGLSAAKDLAAGKNVATTALDLAIHQLPPEYQRAVQVGIAMGHARTLQQGAMAAGRTALELATTTARGHQAANAIAQGMRSPAAIAAVAAAQKAQHDTAAIVRAAQQGHPQANAIVNALKVAPQMIARPRTDLVHVRPVRPGDQGWALPSFL